MSDDDAKRRSVVQLDLSRVASLLELHERLADALGFPKFYGKNWDAFWDSITGLTQMPQRLIITGWSNMTARWPKDAPDHVGLPARYESARSGVEMRC